MLAAAALALIPVQAPAQSVDYATVGPWRLSRNESAAGVTSCSALMAGAGGVSLLLNHAAEGTSLGFIGPRSAEAGTDAQVAVWFDGNRAEAEWLPFHAEENWLVYTASRDAPSGFFDGFANQDQITFQYRVGPGQEQSVTFSLRGTHEVLARTIACFDAGAAAPAPAQAPRTGWTEYRAGTMGPGLATAGTMPDGLPVYLCAAPYRGGRHPGMTGVWSERCSIGYGGAEQQVAQFSVLTGTPRWQRFRGDLPANALQAGAEADGRPLFACRAETQGATLAGKYRPGFQGCNIGDRGREISLAPFDILTH